MVQRMQNLKHEGFDLSLLYVSMAILRSARDWGNTKKEVEPIDYKKMFLTKTLFM